MSAAGVPFGIGRRRQGEIYLAGVRGRKPRVPADPRALEKRARDAMSDEGFAYIAGGAGLETTMDANRAAFERWRIVPRALRDVAIRDITVEVFGRRLPAPFLLAPIGVLEMAHQEADVAVARAAAAEGVPMIFSNQASYPMERCAQAMGESPRWFQLYWSTSDDLVRSFVSRAEGCGCEAIVLTVDTTMLGWRIRDLDLGYLPFLSGKGIAQYTSDPTFERLLAEPAPGTADGDEGMRLSLAALRALIRMTRAYPGRFVPNLRSGRPLAAVRRFMEIYSRPSLSWDDLSLLKEATRLPILLKGVLHREDARRALDAGMDGLVVSNHGGRQIDGAIASLDALPPIIDAAGDSIAVLLDSGIRSGADVFKALALGADAVLIGRPYLWGLALDGQDGVETVLRGLLAELDLTMTLSGFTRTSEIDPGVLRRL